ncbi:hypothetical protein BDK51DRAFT_31465, partial [Blyttiomyces helicus]
MTWAAGDVGDLGRRPRARLCWWLVVPGGSIGQDLGLPGEPQLGTVNVAACRSRRPNRRTIASKKLPLISSLLPSAPASLRSAAIDLSDAPSLGKKMSLAGFRPQSLGASTRIPLSDRMRDADDDELYGSDEFDDDGLLPDVERPGVVGDMRRKAQDALFGTFATSGPSDYKWIKDIDGSYVEQQVGGIFIANLEVDNVTLLVGEKEVVDGWRHSFWATYSLFDVATRKVRPLTVSKPDKPGNEVGAGRVSLALWSPTGHHL